MTDMSDRLRQARLARGFESAADAARRYGWALQTYYAHENGNRSIRLNQARVYARAFGVDVGWLMGVSAKSGLDSSAIRVEGVIMDDREILTAEQIEAAVQEGADPYFSDFKSLEKLAVPFPIQGENLAFLVRTTELEPAYGDGDALVCSTADKIEDCNRKDCVLRLEDGRFIFRKVSFTEDGSVVLEGGPTTAPLVNPRITRIHPVEWVRKNYLRS